MSIEFRSIRDDEFVDLLRLDAAVWGLGLPDDLEQRFRPILETPRTLCAFEAGRMVGCSVALTLQLTVPGGAAVRMAGITWVGVLPTHRRRGIMRSLITGHLERLRGGPEPVAGLGASESQIYRRFGFGIAGHGAHIEIDTDHSAFRRPHADSGSVALLSTAEALALIPAVHGRLCRERNGIIDRPLAGVVETYHDAEKERDGAGWIRFAAHRDAAGSVDGVVSYRITSKWDHAGIADVRLEIIELLAATDEAGAALWRLCLDHDLVRTVTAYRRPVDEPVALLLDDQRRWRQTISDDLQLRPVDVPALLTARRYSREDSLVIEMVDPQLPWAAGRWRLEGGLDGATCTPTEAAADLVMEPAALGAVVLGDTAVELLHRTGEVEEITPGAARRATAMFSWSPRPWLAYMF